MGYGSINITKQIAEKLKKSKEIRFLMV